MNVNNSLLNGDIDEEIYMDNIEGYFQDQTLVFRLRKSLYRIKKAPWAWYAKMDSYLLSSVFLDVDQIPMCI
jgi:hypothetical protein